MHAICAVYYIVLADLVDLMHNKLKNDTRLAKTKAGSRVVRLSPRALYANCRISWSKGL